MKRFHEHPMLPDFSSLSPKTRTYLVPCCAKIVGGRGPKHLVFTRLALYPLEITEPVHTMTAKALHYGLHIKAKRRNLEMLNGSLKRKFCLTDFLLFGHKQD